MKPRVPSYRTIFLFGAAWNAIVERSLWATAFCLACALAAHLWEPR